MHTHYNNSYLYVSIIVCVYNEELLIEKCISSLIGQDYPYDMYEIIIIDDASNDNTQNIIKKWCKGKSFIKRNLTYLRIKRSGLSVARNTGIHLAKGNIIVFIDGDAVADKYFISEYNNTFKNTHCDYSGGTIKLLNNNDRLSQLLQNTRFVQHFGPELYSNHLTGTNMAFKKEILFNYGGFLEIFESRGDDSYMYEILKDNCKYSPSINSVVYHERPRSFIEYNKILNKESEISLKLKLILKSMGKRDRYQDIIYISNLYYTLSLPFTLLFIFLPIPLKYISILSIPGLAKLLFNSYKHIKINNNNKYKLIKNIYYTLFYSLLKYIYKYYCLRNIIFNNNKVIEYSKPTIDDSRIEEISMLLRN